MSCVPSTFTAADEEKKLSLFGNREVDLRLFNRKVPATVQLVPSKWSDAPCEMARWKSAKVRRTD